MSEELFTCDQCGRSGFTRSGFLHHRCNRHEPHDPTTTARPSLSGSAPASGAVPCAPARDTSTPSVPSVPSVASLPPAVRSTAAGASWDNVKRWADQARKFTRAGLACQVMAGFELNALHKAFEIRPGQPRKEFPHRAEISPQLSWAELVEKFAGVSLDTAQRWRMMADGIKPRLKKLDPDQRLRSLLEANPQDWTAADSTLIEQAVLKVTDGYTQTTFLQELGVAKLPPGSGGARPRPEQPVTLTEQLALKERHNREAVNTAFGLLTKLDAAWLTPTRDELNAARDILAATTKAVDYLLATAPTDRDLDTLRRLLAGRPV